MRNVFAMSARFLGNHVSRILRPYLCRSLTTYRKTHEMRSECPKTAFVGLFGRILNVCAMCYTAFTGLFCRQCAFAGCPHTCTRACHISAGFSCRLRPLAASWIASCGAKVRHENHSDKLLRENFTMKRIFRPSDVPYMAEWAWLPP